MAEFDPDKYLAKKQESGEFNPDSYLAEKEIVSQGEAFQPLSEKLASQLSAFSGGAQQGLLAGHADELSGLIGAGLDKGQAALNKIGLASPSPSQVDEKLKSQGFKGDLKSTLDIYKEMRDAKRNELKALEESNTNMMLAGNIVGAGLGLATPAGALLNPTLKGAGLLGGAAKLAVSGAAGGALAGSGVSEATTLPEFAKDIGQGAMFGGGANLLLGGAGQAISKVPSALAKLPVIDDAVAAYQGAKAGKTYTGNVDTFQDKLRDAGSETVQTLKDLSTQKFANKNEALKAATDAGIISDISPQLMDVAEASTQLPSITKEQIKAKKELQRLLNVISKEKNTVKQTPQELEQLIRQVQGVADVAHGASEAQKLASTLKGNIKNQLGEVVPDLPQLNKESHDVMELMKRLTGKEPGDIRPGMDEAGIAAIKDRVTNILKKAKDSPAKLQDILEGFEGVKGLETYAPEKASAIKNTVDTINKDLRLANIANKKRITSGVAETILGNTQTVAVKTGEKLGKTVPGLVNKISDMGPNQLKALAQKSVMKFGKDGEALANVLNNASDKPSQTKNALIFGMMQRPEYRSKLNELHDEEQESKE